MMKFFRKHNKKLLAVFMALLLIVWLGGSALHELIRPDQMRELVATSRFGKIRHLDHRLAQIRTEHLTQLRIHWQTLNEPMWPADQPLSILDWILLTREAAEMGLQLEGDELDTAINTVFRGHFSGTAPPLDVIRQLAIRQDIHIDAYRLAIADFLAIRQLLFTVMRATVPSEAEVRVAARDRLERVTIDAVCLRALSFIDPEQSFTNDQIREQFEMYKDSTPKPGSLTFGYFQPPRVKVEYVCIRQQAIQDNLRMTEEEVEQRARDFWRENRTNDAFKRPIAATQPTTAPATGPAGEYFETYTQARETAHQVVRAARAAEITENLTSWLARHFAKSFEDALEGPDKYRIAPSYIKAPDYVAKTVAAAPFDLSYPMAIEVETTDWFDAESAARLPGIGTAFSLSYDQRSDRLGDLAFDVQGVADYPVEASGDIRARYVSQYQFHPRALRDTDGNRYLFRVVDVTPAHTPESPDVVRDQIVEDLRRKTAFDAAKAALEDLKARAENGGLSAAWEESPDLRDRLGDSGAATSSFDGFFPEVSFARRDWMAAPDADSLNVPSLGVVTTGFVADCFALGQMPDDGPKLALIEQPDDARVILVQWKRTDPMSESLYRTLRPSMAQSIQRVRAMEFQRDWLDPKRIEARTEVKFPPRERSKKKPDLGPIHADDTVEM